MCFGFPGHWQERRLGRGTLKPPTYARLSLAPICFHVRGRFPRAYRRHGVARATQLPHAIPVSRVVGRTHAPDDNIFLLAGALQGTTGTFNATIPVGQSTC